MCSPFSRALPVRPPASTRPSGFCRQHHGSVLGTVVLAVVPAPPSSSPGFTPTESIQDASGLTRHGTACLYARSSHPGGPSGVSYWTPDDHRFVW